MIEFEPGTVLAGRLKVLRRVGAGGVGAVYEIEHQVTRHRRALKVLHPRFRAMPEVVERFLREGSAAGRIGNPHIVETFDAGELDDGAPWLLMELLSGEPLSEVLRRSGRLDFGPACGLVAQVAVALQAAHDAGIVHRDLKPDNLYVIERDGRPFVKVLDFGMSKFDSGMTGAVSMTADGTTVGTPLYMAPEQMRGAKDVDGRADVYALGVILYEALAGGVPYNAASFAELAVLVLGGGCSRLETLRPDAPAGLAELVHRAFAVDPGQRFPTARALADALQPYALIPSASGAWWKPEGEAQGLDATAVRATPMSPDATFPSTPSPLPRAPVPPLPPAAPQPLPPPVPSSLTASGFKRAPSLTRRLRRLGVAATVLVVGAVYSKFNRGEDARDSRHEVMSKRAMSFGAPTDNVPEAREDKAPRLPQPPRLPEPPPPIEVAAAGATPKQPSSVPVAKPTPAPPPRAPAQVQVQRCCEPTQDELLADAKVDVVRLRGPQLWGKPLKLSAGDLTKAGLTPAQQERVEALFKASNVRLHEKLVEISGRAGLPVFDNESDKTLFDKIRDQSHPKFHAALSQVAHERAKLVVRTPAKDESPALQAIDAVMAEDERALREVEEAVGGDAVKKLLGLKEFGRVMGAAKR